MDRPIWRGLRHATDRLTHRKDRDRAMASKQQGMASAAWAKSMKERGIWHGKRITTPHHNNVPVDAAGSAAYRRMRKY